MRPLLLLLLITNLLAACSDSPDPDATPTQDLETTVIPTMSARPTSTVATSPTPLTTAELQGISFDYSQVLLGKLDEAKLYPAQAAGTDAARPQHVAFSFSGSDQVVEGKLYIFPVAHYSALSEAAASHIAILDLLLANKPEQLAAPIPLYPSSHTVDEFLLQPAYVNFYGGHGVGFIATVGEGAEPSLVYAYQGMTDDKSYFISTIALLTGEAFSHGSTLTDNEMLAPVADRQAAVEAELATALGEFNQSMHTLSIPQEQELPELSKPAPEAYLSISGVLLGYDPQVSGNPSVKRKPPVYRSDDGDFVFLAGVPDAITIIFENDHVEYNEAPSLIIQPLRGATGQYYASIPDEQKRKVAAIEMAFSRNGQTSERSAANNEQLLSFQSGIGKRLIKFDDSKVDPTKQPLYQFQGVTSDGRYFVEFKHPVQMPKVSNGPLGDTEPTAIPAYLERLSQLDQMVQSLAIAADASTVSTLPENAADCMHDAQFVEDITLPDHSIVNRGHEVTKIWLIRNTGTCTWTPAYQLHFAGGNPIAWSQSNVIDIVYPGDVTEIGVTIFSPDVPGIYHTWWQLADDLGNLFGPYYHAIFESPQPATDIPGYGVIEGELRYPASGVPAMTIYFLSTDGSQRFALETKDGWNRYVNELPVGEYFVFAKVAGDESGSGGGYTESVLCDMTCDDHALIPVTIEEGIATREINIIDWYAPAGTFPFP